MFVSSLLDGCVSLTPFVLSSFAYARSHSRGWLFLLIWGLTVDYFRIQWCRSSRKLLKFPCGLGLPVLSLDRVLLTSSLSSSGCSRLGLSWLPLMGFDFADLVVWLLLAPRSLKPPSRSTPFAHFVTFWR